MERIQFSLHAVLEESHWWFQGRRRIVSELIRQVVPPRQDLVLVDMGCGTGGNLEALQRDYRCIGIDASPHALRLTRKRFPTLQFMQGSTEAEVFQILSTADACLLTDVLEHVDDDFQLLSSLLAALKPGAHLLLTVPAHEALWTIHDVSFGHYRRYDRRRLQQVWDGLPVTARLVSYYNARLYPIVRLVRYVNRWRGAASGAAGTDFAIPLKPVNRLLSSIFAGESKRLSDALDRSEHSGFPTGVSLIAILRREPEELRPRTKPSWIPADCHAVEPQRA